MKETTHDMGAVSVLKGKKSGADYAMRIIGVTLEVDDEDGYDDIGSRQTRLDFRAHVSPAATQVQNPLATLTAQSIKLSFRTKYASDSVFEENTDFRNLEVAVYSSFRKNSIWQTPRFIGKIALKDLTKANVMLMIELEAKSLINLAEEGCI